MLWQGVDMADAESKPDVLIVDDIPSNLQLLVKLLQREGCRVRPARSGAAAFAILEDVRPDVILLDINMPEMDGFEVCRRLKADPRFRDIPWFFSALCTTPTTRSRRSKWAGWITSPSRC